MLDLKHVNTFVTVAQTGRFSRAAEALDMAQPTVSAHIKALEKELGFDLFDRIGKYAVITADGKEFLNYASDLVDLALKAKAIGSASSEVSGPLNICIVQSVCSYRMPTILQAYNRRYPDVFVNIIVSRPSTYMLEPLRQGEIDAAIVLEAPFDIPSLASKILWSETLQLVVNSSHPFSNLQKVSFDLLKNESFILPEKGAHYRRLFERRSQEAGIQPKVSFEVQSLDAIKRFVMAGMGLSILPTFAVEDEVARGQLVTLPFDGRSLTVNVQLIWHKEKVLNRQAKAFIELVVKHATSDLARFSIH